MKRILVGLVLLIALAGCTTHHTHGELLGITQYEAYNTTLYIPMSCGKDCTMYIPITQHHPAFKRASWRDCTHTGKCETWETDITDEWASTAKVGEVYTFK